MLLLVSHGRTPLQDATGATMVVSPMSEFMSTVMNTQPGVSLAVGLGGAVTVGEDGHSIRAVLALGQGIRDTYEGWGDALLQYHQKDRTRADHDVFVSHLGYSTTVYYFYNQCDCGYHWPRRCDATDPANTPPAKLAGCRTYEDTLIDVHESHKRDGLPISYMLIDSFWYGERQHGGVWMWEDTPELVSDTFPGNASHPGMKRLSAAVGGLPFKAHAGQWSLGKNGDKPNPYFSNPAFKFVTDGRTGLPQGPALWDHVFSVNQNNYNLRAIKQDHMNEQLSMRQCTTTTNVARDWLAGMGDAAQRHNFSIQYCMTLPSVTMNSVTIPPSTHQRLGSDYLAGANEKNWRIGAAAIFIHAVGLLPFKDAFLSNTSQAPPTHSNTGDYYKGGGFEGFKEEAPELHAASALLSRGPVSPSDGVDGHNMGLLLSLCRSDGTLLKPDKPARTIDAKWLGSLDHTLDPSTGVVWTTATAFDGLLWGYVFVQAATSSWNATARDLGLDRGISAGVVWQRPKDQAHSVASKIVTAKFGLNSPLLMPITGVDYNDASWELLYTAPVLSNGFVVLGEADKMVPVSTQRISQISVRDNGVTVALVGAAGESVVIHYLAPGTTTSQFSRCILSESGTGTATLSL